MLAFIHSVFQMPNESVFLNFTAIAHKLVYAILLHWVRRPPSLQVFLGTTVILITHRYPADDLYVSVSNHDNQILYAFAYQCKKYQQG